MAAMVAFVVTIVVGMHEANDGLGVKSLTGDSLTLTGVNRKFAEAAEALSGCAAAGGPTRPGVRAPSRPGNRGGP